MISIEEKFREYLCDADLTFDEVEFEVIRKHLKHAENSILAEFGGKDKLLSSFRNIKHYCESHNGLCSERCVLYALCVEKGISIPSMYKLILKFLETGEI